MAAHVPISFDQDNFVAGPLATFSSTSPSLLDGCYIEQAATDGIIKLDSLKVGVLFKAFDVITPGCFPMRLR